MQDNQNFTDKLNSALYEKAQWFNKVQLPKMLEHYRLLHTCAKNIFNILESKALITSDPYKLDKKISNITIPEDTPFMDSDKARILGSRFSDYESMLDFICTYFDFSVENIDLTNIKNLNDFNNAFQWTKCSKDNQKINTKNIAMLIEQAKQNTSVLIQNTLNDAVAKSSSSIIEITKILKELTDYQKEAYKAKIRLDVIEHPSFNKEIASSSPEAELAEIKKVYSKVIAKKTIYHELIAEIVKEDHDQNKIAIQNKILEKLKIVNKVQEKKENKIDPKVYLIEGVKTISSLANEYKLIAEKLEENYNLLENTNKSFFDKFKAFLRKAFNLPNPKVFYTITITNENTQAKTVQNIDILQFISNITKKSNFYFTLQNRSSIEYKKINTSSQENLLVFLNKQISENQEFYLNLVGLDDYFKSKSTDKAKIKGLKMNLLTIKNSLINTNKHRGEYTSLIEETEQLKKLGIVND